MQDYSFIKKTGINDLKSLFAFEGNSQGDTSCSNSIEEFIASKGWMSFMFKCDLTKEAIDEELAQRKLWNDNYIKELKENGTFGEDYCTNVSIELDPLYDSPISLESAKPLMSHRITILDFSNHEKVIDWEEEMEKCKKSFYYFYTNYMLVDGRKATTRLNEENFNRLINSAIKPYNKDGKD